jgi:hypothetical protein
MKALLIFLTVVGLHVNCADGLMQFPLHNMGGYMWYTTLHVGDNAFNYTIDTGSSDFIVIGANCTDCGVPERDRYRPSSDARSVPCATAAHFNETCPTCVRGVCASSVDYGGSITEAFFLVQDVVLVNGDNMRSVIGSVYNLSMSEVHARRSRLASTPQPTGMWGLGYATLSAAGGPTLFDSIVGNFQIPRAFEISLRNSGGTLWLGGGTRPAYDFALQPAPFDFYRVHMESIAVGNSTIDVPPASLNNPCIVDTGTPTPTVPSAAFGEVVRAFNALCDSLKLHGVCDVPANVSVLLGSACYEYTPAQVASFPTISFRVTGFAGGEVVLEYPPAIYLIPQYYCASPTARGFAFQADDNFTVLGATLLVQFDVLFDVANSRIGFARA